ncbi:MAG: type II toxin-antitoxin system RelE/ParE family toxin [Candidatus Obscuribacterales bacterium]|nr:type II toxin-antitoxin system RelE/ParE family toxin [Candidatus Obscuribacterales bacterium]
MRISISPQAEEDLREIADFIAKDNLDAAIDFVERLRQRCADLLPFPAVGRKRDEVRRGYRSVTEGKYVIFYRLFHEDELVIVRIVHGKRDLGKVLGS